MSELQIFKWLFMAYSLQKGSRMFYPRMFYQAIQRSRFLSLFQGIILSQCPISGSNIQNVNKIMKSRANALKKYNILRIHMSMEISKRTSELMQVNS